MSHPIIMSNHPAVEKADSPQKLAGLKAAFRKGFEKGWLTGIMGTLNTTPGDTIFENASSAGEYSGHKLGLEKGEPFDAPESLMKAAWADWSGIAYDTNSGSSNSQPGKTAALFLQESLTLEQLNNPGNKAQFTRIIALGIQDKKAGNQPAESGKTIRAIAYMLGYNSPTREPGNLALTQWESMKAQALKAQKAAWEERRKAQLAQDVAETKKEIETEKKGGKK